MKYLVTGQAGSGKSSVAAELRRRGYVAYDTDSMPAVTWFDHVATGEPVAEGSREITHPIDFDRFAWNWRPEALRALLESAEDVFVYAITSNTVELRHHFDTVFVLELDEQTLAERLRTRTDHDFGKHPAEAAAVLRHNRVIADEWRERGAIAIDATGSVGTVVDEIVRQMR